MTEIGGNTDSRRERDEWWSVGWTGTCAVTTSWCDNGDLMRGRCWLGAVITKGSFIISNEMIGIGCGEQQTVLFSTSAYIYELCTGIIHRTRAALTVAF